MVNLLGVFFAFKFHQAALISLGILGSLKLVDRKPGHKSV
jgi:hypothetical protein